MYLAQNTGSPRKQVRNRVNSKHHAIPSGGLNRHVYRNISSQPIRQRRLGQGKTDIPLGFHRVGLNACMIDIGGMNDERSKPSTSRLADGLPNPFGRSDCMLMSEGEPY
jgi:hypothetical protein